MGGTQGQATDMDIYVRNILKKRQMLNEILARHTGQPIERIMKDTERDTIFDALEAKEYGLIDEILPPRR
jgi:ATP-dependent Clp protease protease subunit